MGVWAGRPGGALTMHQARRMAGFGAKRQRGGGLGGGRDTTPHPPERDTTRRSPNSPPKGGPHAPDAWPALCAAQTGCASPPPPLSRGHRQSEPRSQKSGRGGEAGDGESGWDEEQANGQGAPTGSGPPGRDAGQAGRGAGQTRYSNPLSAAPRPFRCPRRGRRHRTFEALAVTDSGARATGLTVAARGATALPAPTAKVHRRDGRTAVDAQACIFWCHVKM